MLIASVIVYFICYAPAQLPLVHGLIFATAFAQNWYFHALIMTLAYTNSAINPLLYTVFSQKFRQQFSRYLCYCCYSATGNVPSSSSIAACQLTANLTTSRQRLMHVDTNYVIQSTPSASPTTSRQRTTQCINLSDKFS